MEEKIQFPLMLSLMNNKVILITGPNAGGKTVVLKTIGILSLMVQSGISYSRHPDSVIFICLIICLLILVINNQLKMIFQLLVLIFLILKIFLKIAIRKVSSAAG